ncbi:hypothetical protein ACFFX1_35335 [Dactylosporangium sucinum]|uniref:Uncharacterized protein n=1 Tax=Dactylosporangium sucinum TaxID=1424081 RepID=A0A917UAF1_9ACTN|nr:hypothetical protein [Dactylosporangium sucinum]GGM66017.1 hypothetical protein GCM10007977_079500 [Dactylosporangium sucinum]
MTQESPVTLAIGGSAAAGDVARHLTGGRAVRAVDGRTVLVYAGAAAAVRDVTAYLRPRAMSFVRFGLEAGEPQPNRDRFGGPAVTGAQALADRAGPRELLLSETVRESLTGTAVEPAGDGTYRLSGTG